MKRIVVLIGAVATLLFAFAIPAGADDHSPTLTAEPSSVDAAGEHEITFTAADFAPTGGFLLPCEGAGADLDVLAAGDPTALCDLAALTPYNPADDGTWTATVTYNIPAEGLAVAAGDTGGANAASALITVGAMEEAMEEEAMEEEAMEEEAMEEEAMDDLAETGVESSLLLVIGATVLLAGGLFVSTRRQHS